MANEKTAGAEDHTQVLTALSRRIAARLTGEAAKGGAPSYTRQLAEGGRPLAARKLGEEAVELVVAALASSQDASHEEMVHESADLLFHWLVLMHLCAVPPEAAYRELARRMEEK